MLGCDQATNACWSFHLDVATADGTRRGSWFPFVDTYRTLCMVPGQELRRVLDQFPLVQLSERAADLILAIPPQPTRIHPVD